MGDLDTRPKGVSAPTWAELLAHREDTAVHSHLTQWRLGQLSDIEMLARLAAAQTQRVRELTAQCAELLSRAPQAPEAAESEDTVAGP